MAKVIPPKHLSSAAVAKWREILPTLEARGDLEQGMLDGLAAYSVAWATWTECQQKIAELGMVIATEAGVPAIGPYVTIAEKAQRQMRQWSDALHLIVKPKGNANQPATAPVIKTSSKQTPFKGLTIVTKAPI